MNNCIDQEENIYLNDVIKIELTDEFINLSKKSI